MNARWNLVLLPSAIVCLLLLFGTRFVFLRAGFYEDRSLGLIGDRLQIDNYVTAFRDSFYFDALWLTMYLSALVVVCSLVVAYPAAYAIARMRSQWAIDCFHAMDSRCRGNGDNCVADVIPANAQVQGPESGHGRLSCRGG